MLVKIRNSEGNIVASKELNVTAEQIQRWQDGEHLQRAMPNLTADEREFFLTGGILSDEDWAKLEKMESEDGT